MTDGEDYGAGSSPKGLSRWLKIVGLTIAITSVIGWGIIYPRSGGYLQRTNMESALRWKPKVEAVMRQDPRFARVATERYTGMDGALGFYGDVDTAADLAVLQRLVGDMRVPVPIYWSIRVLDE